MIQNIKVARKRSVNSYERTLKILRYYNYKISDDGFVSLNGSGVLGKITEEGKLEIFLNIPIEHKRTLEDNSVQRGINYVLRN